MAFYCSTYDVLSNGFTADIRNHLYTLPAFVRESDSANARPLGVLEHPWDISEMPTTSCVATSFLPFRVPLHKVFERCGYKTAYFKMPRFHHDASVQTQETKKDVGTQTDPEVFEPKIIIPTKYQCKFHQGKRKRDHN
jgi:hypothetical protein